MVKVMDLRTGEYVAEYTCSPKEAVVCAFAQLDHKDFNTWRYDERYGVLVEEGKVCFLCGDYCALKDSHI